MSWAELLLPTSEQQGDAKKISVKIFFFLLQKWGGVKVIRFMVLLFRQIFCSLSSFAVPVAAACQLQAWLIRPEFYGFFNLGLLKADVQFHPGQKYTERTFLDLAQTNRQIDIFWGKTQSRTCRCKEVLCWRWNENISFVSFPEHLSFCAFSHVQAELGDLSSPIQVYDPQLIVVVFFHPRICSAFPGSAARH